MKAEGVKVDSFCNEHFYRYIAFINDLCLYCFLVILATFLSTKHKVLGEIRQSGFPK